MNPPFALIAKSFKIPPPNTQATPINAILYISYLNTKNKYDVRYIVFKKDTILNI